MTKKKISRSQQGSLRGSWDFETPCVFKVESINIKTGIERIQALADISRSVLYTSLFHRLGRNIQANKQQEIEKKHKSNTYLTVNRLMLMLLRTTTHLKLHICHY